MTDAQKRYETERHALFFKEEACKKLYKDHVTFMVNRVNSYTGKAYKNDPTILAWNLINEPRCETWVPANSWCPDALAGWFKVSWAVNAAATAVILDSTGLMQLSKLNVVVWAMGNLTTGVACIMLPADLSTLGQLVVS